MPLPDVRNDCVQPPCDLQQTVLLLGASTRAAAHSALRAGVRPVCADAYADADLVRFADVLAVPHYPQDAFAAARETPLSPWMYTGAIENHPRLVARLCETHPLWGNGAETLIRVRNPWMLARELREARLPHLAVWPDDGSVPPFDGGWLLKSCRGSAGRGILEWSVETASPHASGPVGAGPPLVAGPAVSGAISAAAHYFQQKCFGVPISGVYLALPGRTLLIGITRQLIGLPVARAPRYAYCGTLAPFPLPYPMQKTVEQVGSAVGAAFALRGLFGCDFIADAAGPWLTEVNPRYTASVEVVEHALGLPLFDWHRRTCEAFLRAGAPQAALDLLHSEILEGTSRPPRRVVGKMVLYADRPLVAGDWTRFISDPRTLRIPAMADIPHRGQEISAGHPICSLFATAGQTNACLRKLLSRAASFYRR